MGTVKECSVRGVDILLDVDTEDESSEVRNYEMWRVGHYDHKEPDTLDWIDNHFQQGDTVFDVGANIGQYSLYAAKRLGMDLRILAFEPEALNFAKLNRNIVLNGMIDIVVPYPIAISNRTAVDTFYSKTFAVGASLHALGRQITQGEVAFAPQNKQGIVSSSLDDLTTTFGLPMPNHIKVDVDGIEDLIVEGATGLFERPELQTFLIEVYMHGDIAQRVRNGFEAGGFVLSNEADTDFTIGVVQNLIFTRP
ncbi:MAG: FkbM family methyltransferase [Candidatus Latescibacterota bacterium]|nr:FkbM family methyltransferase [Candidatus Latescibacterota bacterium]